MTASSSLLLIIGVLTELADKIVFLIVHKAQILD